jgi:hypothetical protein
LKKCVPPEIDGEKVISVIVINKQNFELQSQENQALVIHHEIAAHVTPLIGHEEDVYKDKELEEHEKFHGHRTPNSPMVGSSPPAKPNTPQAKFEKEMKESSFNEKKVKRNKKGN